MLLEELLLGRDLRQSLNCQGGKQNISLIVGPLGEAGRHNMIHHIWAGQMEILVCFPSYVVIGLFLKCLIWLLCYNVL